MLHTTNWQKQVSRSFHDANVECLGQSLDQSMVKMPQGQIPYVSVKHTRNFKPVNIPWFLDPARHRPYLEAYHHQLLPLHLWLVELFKCFKMIPFGLGCFFKSTHAAVLFIFIHSIFFREKLHFPGCQRWRNWSHLSPRKLNETSSVSSYRNDWLKWHPHC
jgi:hypothetical protein